MSKPTQKKRFTNVVDMVRDFADDDFAQELEQQIAERTIVKSLIGARVSRNVSQDDIAQQLGCTQSRVSKIEGGKDADLTLGELAAYASAFGNELEIVPHPIGSKAVDRVKTFARCIHRELKGLARLAKGDQSIAAGAEGFFGETFYNMVRFIQDAAKDLPKRPSISMQLGSELDDAQPEAAKAVPASRKRARRKDAAEPAMSR